MRGLPSILHRVAHAALGRRLSERLWLFVLVFLAQLRVLLAYLPYQTEVPSGEVLPLVLSQLLRIGGWASLLTLYNRQNEASGTKGTKRTKLKLLRRNEAYA